MFAKVKYKKIRLCLKITSTHQIMFINPIKNESNIGAPFFLVEFRSNILSKSLYSEVK